MKHVIIGGVAGGGLKNIFTGDCSNKMTINK